MQNLYEDVTTVLFITTKTKKPQRFLSVGETTNYGIFKQ